MLDEGDEDNELALLEPVVEGADSTPTSFVYQCLWCAKKDEKEHPVPRRLVDERIRI